VSIRTGKEAGYKAIIFLFRCSGHRLMLQDLYQIVQVRKGLLYQSGVDVLQCLSLNFVQFKYFRRKWPISSPVLQARCKKGTKDDYCDDKALHLLVMFDLTRNKKY
jgi:hypothetical protein